MPTIREIILNGFRNVERNDDFVFSVIVNEKHLSEIRSELSDAFDGSVDELSRSQLNYFGTLYAANVYVDSKVKDIIFLTREEEMKRREKLMKKTNKISTYKEILNKKIDHISKLKFIGR